MMMAEYDRQTIEELIDGTIDFYKLKEMLSNFKDANRFETYLSILQERVSWDDRILLPAGLHLYIVQKPNGERIVKCDCGHEFCDYRDNWKLHALIYVRDNQEKLEELYPRLRPIPNGR
jgi:acetone carboxylase gamma subunit